MDGLRRAPVRDVVEPVVRGLGAHADTVYVHVDVDVHDPSCGGSNHYAPAAGLSAAEVRSVIDVLAQRLPVRVAGITAFDPDYDTDGRMVENCLSLLSAMLSAHARGASLSH